MTPVRIEVVGEAAYLLVDSTGHALRAEKRLQASGIPCRLVPVPRRLSSDCGASVRIAAADVERAREALDG